jgi:hypothetical protein
MQSVAAISHEPPKPRAESFDRFERDGVLFPIPVVSEDEASGLRRRFEQLEAHDGGRLSAATRKKPHLLVPWLADLVRHPAIVGPVTELLGPDLLCWSSLFFAKQAGEGTYVAWHQDATYWGLSEASVVTAWLAFTPSTPESGCLRVIPGSHTSEQLPHRVTGDAANLLSRGQEIAVEVDERQAVDVVLRPGEMSIHHVRLIHGSEPNRADHPRIGYAIRYISAHVRQLTTFRDSATLVAGRDLGNFDLEPKPRTEFDADALAYHAAMLARQAEIQGAIG